MQSNRMDKQLESGSDIKGERRKLRVKRMKTAIIFTVIGLFLLPTILCIILGLRVLRLENQVENLMEIHRSEMDTSSIEKQTYNGVIAYAAEKTQITDENSEEASEKAEEVETESTTYNIEQGTKTTETNATHTKTTEINATEDTGAEVKDPLNPNPINTGLVEEQLNNNSPDTEELNWEVNGSVEKISQNEKVIEGIYAGKKVYLTFDDGPSCYTDEILDILDYYGVKATFFVIGKTDKESKQLYQRILDEGHTLGMHSYSHKYKEIYNSLEDFDKDFTKLWKLLYDTTGYIPKIYRFPGGSSNLANKQSMNEIIKYLDEKSMLYYDWNVDNGDATGVIYTKDQLIDNVLTGIAGKQRSIVLMHDVQTKRTTVDSLSELLETLINQGAEVLPLSEEVKPIQQIKAEKVK